MTTSKHASAVATLASLAVLAACGGGTDTSLSPAKLQQVGSVNLAGHPNAMLPDSIKVKVLTGDDQPIANATVQWVARTGGGSAGAGTNTTNADGIAANTWTLGPTTGDQMLEVTVPGTAVPALTLIANAQAVGGGGDGGGSQP